MAIGKSNFVRFQSDPEFASPARTNSDSVVNLKHKAEGKNTCKVENKNMTLKTGNSLKAKVLSRVFSEDYEKVKEKTLDPRGSKIRRWNKIFLVACLVSLFVDPLFFYMPVVRHNDVCMDIDVTLRLFLTVLRSLGDLFYVVQIYMQFRTAYVAPSSRVVGRGELIIDSKKVMLRYFRKDFWVDLIAALPLPQVLIWIMIPNASGPTVTNMKNVVRFTIIFQLVPRLYLMLRLWSKIVNLTGVLTETAWAGAAYNLLLYMLASNVIGACYYLLAIERQEACWKSVCNDERPTCQYRYFECNNVEESFRQSWFESSNVTTNCDPDSSYYLFGIFEEGVNLGVTSVSFIRKYFYSLFWGLRMLTCLGQELDPSTYVGEIVFIIIIAILGLFFFALLIGNIQRYIQSTNIRLEEWRIKKTDAEQWMHHRQLPPEIRQSVRKYNQYKWVATRGVDEEALLKELPMDLKRDIKRHLCLDLVRKVPLFDQMDERMLDAICERLQPTLCTEGIFFLREGDPVNEMLFIIRGHLDSYTTNGGRTGFFNSCRIGPGDFCGDELLTWALNPRPSVILPSSTRTVKSISAVEAFALKAEDLKFVAAQFRRLHSKKLRHKFRFYSHQWRTWAACFIQAAWCRYLKRKEADELRAKEESAAECYSHPQMSVLSTCVARFASSSRRSSTSKRFDPDSDIVNLLQKPAEPDFSIED